MPLSKIGARVWIAHILITWGIISGGTAFVVGPLSFDGVRFALGIAEAGGWNISRRRSAGCERDRRRGRLCYRVGLIARLAER